MKQRQPWLGMAFLVAVGCSNEAAETEETEETASSEEAEQTINVGAAADLYHAFTVLGEEVEEETGIGVTFSFGSTGQMTHQIEQGASYDVFAAAHESYIDRLIDADAVDEASKQRYAVGQIGIMHDGNTAEALSVEDLTGEDIERIAIANPEHAPYGEAAQQALETWGIWDEVEDKLVYGENIRQTLQYTESGNVDAGIVALALSIESDLLYDPIDPGDHEPIVQALAVPSRSEQPEAAAVFIEYLFSDEGQDIMNDYGFRLPEE
ncbi:molybdate ABC transporter substrate-binding protein [Alkalicoccus chagannorensis]|uniref:molybdate ABC transporter substrate-binding protein n=1 Tax=Alkalicoccus chagannorensis TaxID=427072 RepID=UPI00040B7EEE|nr:molybdate ABC transporter substrate-binding protein [Alkalicoccus chagannorensis]